MEILVFVPLGLAFYFTYLAWSLQDNEPPVLKWGYRLLGMVFLLPYLSLYDTIAAQQVTYTNIADVLDPAYAAWIIVATLGIMMIGMFIYLFKGLKSQKHEDLEVGRL